MSPSVYFSGIFNKYFKYSKSLKLLPANCLISLAVLGPLDKIITSFPSFRKYFNTGKKISVTGKNYDFVKIIFSFIK